MSTTQLPPGTAPIKSEYVSGTQCPSSRSLGSRYILANDPQPLPDDDAAEGSSSHVNGRKGENGADHEDARDQTGPRRKKWSKEEKKNKRGANKGRRFQRMRDDVELCWKVASGRSCEFGDAYVLCT